MLKRTVCWIRYRLLEVRLVSAVSSLPFQPDLLFVPELKLEAASEEGSTEMTNKNPGLKKNPGVAIAEFVQLAMEKRDFRSQDDRSDKEKKETLQNRQETAQNSQYEEHPSQAMPEDFFQKYFFHQIEAGASFRLIIFCEKEAAFCKNKLSFVEIGNVVL